MVKKDIGDRICRDCGKLIIGRRIDAITCKECRRMARVESSRKDWHKRRNKKITEKITQYGVKRTIEREKALKILEGLKKEIRGKPDISKGELFNTFICSPDEIVEALGLNLGFGISWEEFEKQDIEDIKAFIEMRIEKEKEKIREEYELKRKRESLGFGVFDKCI